MLRSVRFRCTILRHILFWVLAITCFKVTAIFYYDLQERSIDPKRSSLPFDIQQFQNLNDNLSADATAQHSNGSITSEIKAYRQYVETKNREQEMFNQHLFHSNRTRYVLLVQVHKRVVYLKRFIEMLRSVATINETLVIFSHDFIDSDINALITGINFVPVRIFVWTYDGR